MKAKYIIAIITCILFLQSCSKMVVDVDIFDYNELKKSEDYRVIQKENTIKYYDYWISAIEKLSTDYINDFKQELATNKDIEESVRKNAPDLIIQYMQKGTSKFVLQIQNAKDLLLTNKLDESLSVFVNAKNDYLIHIRNLKEQLNTTYRIVFFDDNIEKKVEQVSKNMSFQDSNYIYGESILSDHLASLIARSPEKYWQKLNDTITISNISENDNSNKFRITNKHYKRKGYAQVNSTKARAFFGNSDVAIMMDAPGHFVVKGVRVDSDEAIKASFKVFNQGIKYLAYASGIPIPATSENTEKLTLPEITENNRLKIENNILQNESELYTEAFVKELVLQLSKIKKTNSPETNADINNRIKEAFDAYKLLIKQNR